MLTGPQKSRNRCTPPRTPLPSEAGEQGVHTPATTELRAKAPKTVERAQELAAQFGETTQDPYTLPDRRGDISVGRVLAHYTGTDGTETVLDNWDGARVYCIIDISDYTPTR